ncbi:hypothetical protein LP316_03165 [Thalassotalea sp. LPB0316]|uniref:hypothetical protein n=1 Tax=Thalassotalea sp. LPB0316 TaxID=2769490 RepID=UPI001868C711|nr:hypothetical protein [Thalassotalea sp. LPB0316]QOL26319.1 hypothetical protein LP316_03165 [Thalassotalea sp. LPB0316]
MSRKSKITQLVLLASSFLCFATQAQETGDTQKAQKPESEIPLTEAERKTIEQIEELEQKVLRPIPELKPLTELTVSPEMNDWMEEVHRDISESVHQSMIWFDGFFNDNPGHELMPKSLARISTSWLPRARDWSEVKIRFKLKAKLPYFKNKVDVIFSDDDYADQLPLESEQVKGSFEESSFAAAIRYIHKQDSKEFTDTRVGISGSELFVRSRYKRTHVWQEKHSFIFTPSIEYYTDDGLGARLLLEYDYQLNPDHLFRLNYSIRGSESFSGIRWKHGLYYLRHISDKEASVFGFLVEGERNGENGFLIENHTLSYRYRFNAIKKWLFFEIEPFVEWPEEDNYSTTPGIAFKVEGYFAKG